MMPLISNATTADIPRPPTLPDPTAMPGEWYFGIVVIFLLILVSILVIYLIIRFWGNPILVAASSRRTGDAIIQHFENSRIGIFKIAPIGQGAIRHKKIADGTLITTPGGINNLNGHSFVNSWNLLGISLPTFLIGGVSKLRQAGIRTRNELECLIQVTPDMRYNNLISESYNFNDFAGILLKSKDPAFINLEIEHVNDFIESVNQHYTESEITKEIRSYIMKLSDGFAGMILMTAIAIFIVALAIYIMMGAVK